MVDHLQSLWRRPVCNQQGPNKRNCLLQERFAVHIATLREGVCRLHIARFRLHAFGWDGCFPRGQQSKGVGLWVRLESSIIAGRPIFIYVIVLTRITWIIDLKTVSFQKATSLIGYMC